MVERYLDHQNDFPGSVLFKPQTRSVIFNLIISNQSEEQSRVDNITLNGVLEYDNYSGQFINKKISKEMAIYLARKRGCAMIAREVLSVSENHLNHNELSGIIDRAIFIHNFLSSDGIPSVYHRIPEMVHNYQLTKRRINW